MVGLEGFAVGGLGTANGTHGGEKAFVDELVEGRLRFPDLGDAPSGSAGTAGVIVDAGGRSSGCQMGTKLVVVLLSDVGEFESGGYWHSAAPANRTFDLNCDEKYGFILEALAIGGFAAWFLDERSRFFGCVRALSLR
jgi:hypothetical protein